MKPKSALNLFVCKCLTLHPLTFRHFFFFNNYVFFKGCENMCDDHIAQQFKMIEERVGQNSQGLLRNDDSVISGVGI